MPIPWYFISLVLTLLLEGGVSCFFGFCQSRFLLTLLYVNLITHPLLHFVLALLPYMGYQDRRSWILLALEPIVAIVEWRLYVFTYGPDNKDRLAIFSIAANTVSYGTGLMIGFIWL